MLGGSIEDVRDIAPIGIISAPREDGGLPAPDNEAADIEGDSEYERPSPCIDGIVIGAERRL